MPIATKLREGNVFSPVCSRPASRTWDLTVQGPSFPAPDMFRLVHYEAHTVGKRAVRIILECCLVSNCERRTTYGVLQVNYRQFEK